MNEFKATPKQIQVLLKAGITIEDILAMTKEQVSEKIGSIFEKKGWDNTPKGEGIAVVRPGEEQKTLQEPSVSQKTTYVTCAKDLVVSGVNPDDSIAMVKRFKEAFE